MFEKLKSYLINPEPYAKSSARFWDDPYISQNMLKAHLDPQWEAATRKPEDVSEITRFIYSQTPIDHPTLLDLGCGPGLYAEKFHALGFKVTGVDFSIRSINYAIQSAKEKKLDVTYIHMNYLELDVKEAFDVITLIYCDYSALEKKDRILLLKKIKQALKPHGLFFFDVFTPKQYPDNSDQVSWSYIESNGFFKEEEHLLLEKQITYDHDLHLYQYITLTKDDQLDVYRIWDQAFTPQTIKNELKEAGFNHVEIYSDLKGNPYDQASKTLGIMVTT